MTINLERELIKANKKLATPAELLVLKEYEQHGELLKDDSLERVGLTQNLKKGNEIKTKVEKLKAETLKFDQSRVFHISQIEETCMKYYLRFLPSIHYKGTLDKELPFKINAFEAAYQVKCQCDHINVTRPIVTAFYPSEIYIVTNPLTGEQELRNTNQDKSLKIQNTFIMAPKSSFELQEVPKDPLFFYKINEEYYYLIHKWGNDLNIGRRVIGFLSNSFNWWLTFAVPSVIAVIGSVLGEKTGFNVAMGSLNAAFFVVNTVMYFAHGDSYSPIKNNWNSPYKD